MDLPRDGPQHDSCFEQCRASCLGVHVHSLAPDNTNQRPPCHGVSVEFGPIIFLRNFCLCSLDIKYYVGSLPACYLRCYLLHRLVQLLDSDHGQG